MRPRERLLRLVGGIATIVLGCVVYGTSQALDPDNRAALLGIIAILVGITWLGQGIRGHTEGPVRPTERLPGAPAISSERTAVGAFLAWLVPGLGHWMIGRRAKALLFFVTITATFVLGIYLAEGRNIDYERNAVYYLAYVFNLGEIAVAWLLARGLEYDHPIRFLEVGYLYTAVACLLNLVVIMDFIATCIRSGAPAEEERPAEEVS
jgi:hypothetical protein